MFETSDFIKREKRRKENDSVKQEKGSNQITSELLERER